MNPCVSLPLFSPYKLFLVYKMVYQLLICFCSLLVISLSLARILLAYYTGVHSGHLRGYLLVQ